MKTKETRKSIDDRMDGRTAIITGGRTGVGKAIARKLLLDGANVVIVGTTGAPHAKKQGTIFTAAEELSQFGNVIGVACDVQDASQCATAVAETILRFGGIDVLINDAGALDHSTTATADPKRAKLVFNVNPLGSFNMTQAALKGLLKSNRPRVLNITPPMGQPGRPMSKNWLAKWVASNPAYTASKFAMSLLTLGWSEEYAKHGFAVSGLWFESIIDTPALTRLPGTEVLVKSSRKPDIGADAAMEILSAPRLKVNGKLFIDAQALLVLKGVKDLSDYATEPSHPLALDWYVDKPFSDSVFHDRAELEKRLQAAAMAAMQNRS